MSYTHLLYHIVFRPKNNAPVITVEHEECLYRYIWGLVKAKKGTLYRIGGMPDHVHMLVQLPPTLPVADFVRDLKTATHLFLRGERDKFPLFGGWESAYCALTCSASDKERVVAYIKGQKEHHRRTSFRDEYLFLLREYGIEPVGEE